MKEVIERCKWLVNKCEDKAITPDVKDDVSYLLEEIERLNKDNGDIIKLFAKEREETKRLHSIIKEAREYIEENYPTSTINYQDDKLKLLEILDKVGETDD